MERYQGKPFALVGVNFDQDPEVVLRLQGKGTVTWRSFSDTKGEIADAYRLHGIPTVVLIDHKGVIQFISGVPDQQQLDEKLDELVAAAEVGR